MSMSAEIRLPILKIGQDEDLLAAVIHLALHGARFIDEPAVDEGLVNFQRGQLVLCRLEELFRENEQFLPLSLIHEILHIGGVGSPVFHVEVIADAMQVVVGGVIEKTQGGAQGDRVLVFEVLLRTPFENELDESLELRGDDESVDGKGPYDGIGRLDVVHDFLKGFFVSRDLVDLLAYVVGLKRVLGKFFSDEIHVLKRYAQVSLGAAA
jgi:hypothetical protein